ncbi:ATP-dependent helicase [Spiribacter halobius]|uniref:ATP-dependent helicase n=1 Tax=Sediminicurvatus halobius TaxID=2182432 RepID=A0A2U2N852_9GAMM|nr:ATP-dependent helicase [Spiribacter halobius]
MSFDSLNLDPILLRAVTRCGFDTPSDIQREAIPLALAGKDLMASAQTGTGKTAAFVLPALQRLLTPPARAGRGPRVLVLTPTRELATQVSEAIGELGRFTRLSGGAVVGGMPYPPQQRLLRQPLDLLVATPGRLMDHMERGRVDFSRLELLVLDEADRMLDMGFVDAVERIAAATPQDRQTLLFSATFEGAVKRVADRLLREPVRLEMTAVTARHEDITQRVHQADHLDHKHALLDRLLREGSEGQALVFTSTKRGADALASRLRDEGHRSNALHGDMSQHERRRAVEQLRGGRVRVMVATDVAARGLDIRTLGLVINFDLPNSPEDYVHRIGRTGRGGDQGTAISLIGRQDWPRLARIERLTGQRLERAVLSGLEPRYPEPRGGSERPGRGRGGPRRGSGPARGAPRRRPASA